MLLATVAILQYRWTNEATVAAEMRMGTQLESLMTKWHVDLYGELANVCVAIGVGPDSGARDTWNDYLERYTEWRNEQSRETLVNIHVNSDLVQDIYIWDTNLQTKPRLFRLNADKKKIEIASVPQNLETLLVRLRTNSANLPMALGAWQLPDGSGERAPVDTASGTISPRSDRTTGWQFDDNVPAIVHPIFDRHTKLLRSRNAVDWMVIVLDLNVIQKRILPELAVRYFGGLDGLDYKVAVVKTGPTPRAIYSSDPGFGIRDIGAVDSRMNIFGSPPETVEGQFLQGGENTWPPRGAEWRSFVAPVWFPVIAYGSRVDPWMLVLQHRAASVQAALDQVRRKNLVLSALVLLLLGASISVLALATFRAHAFAKLQMDFVASVSHELRTPLTAIFSAGENIKDGVVSGKAGFAHYGSIIVDESHQLMAHVDRILLFAAIRSGKVRYNLCPLQISEILDRVRKNTPALTRRDSCILEVDVQPGLPCVVGDLFAVCSCLENLVTNAVKYGGGVRHVRLCATLQDTDNHAGKEVAISVEDHGIGISSSELKHVFEPFYRSSTVTEARIQGTGLGLSVAKHLAESMGGGLSVTSEVGRGSVFTLHLPAAPTWEGDLSAVSSASDKVTRNE